MQNKTAKIICLLLCVVLVLLPLGACSKSPKPTNNTSSNPSSQSDSSSLEPNTDSDTTDSSDTSSEDGEPSDTGEEPDIIQPIDDDDIEDIEDEAQIFNVYNSKKPIITNYRGMSGTVYHMFGFAKDDKSGRVYTDMMMDLELGRLKDSGMRYMRTRFDTKWAWDPSTDGWNTNSRRMNYFYEYCRALNKFDAKVILQVGWYLDFIVKGGTGSITEAAYLGGFDNDLYAESTNYADCIAEKYKKTGSEKLSSANFRGQTETVTEYYNRMGKAALRYGYIYAQTLKALKARGINNVEYLLYFTEPSTAYGLPDDMQMGYYGNEYIYICKTIKNVLGKENVAKIVKHIGPNQYVPHGNGLMRYVAEREPDLFDVLSVHQYPQSNEIVLDVYAGLTSEYFSSYRNTLDTLKLSDKKELWVDEFMALSKWFGQTENQTFWHGLQTVVGAITAQQYGIQNIILWQMCSQLWTDETFSSDEFYQGIHNVGILPSLFISAIPNPSYYAVGLFSRYNGSKNGIIYPTNYLDQYGMYMGAVKLEDGSWTITVINLDVVDQNFVLKFDKSINQTLYRHLQEFYKVNPTTAARLQTVDRVYLDVKRAFTDTIPAASIAVYTGLKF